MDIILPPISTNKQSKLNNFQSWVIFISDEGNKKKNFYANRKVVNYCSTIWLQNAIGPVAPFPELSPLGLSEPGEKKQKRGEEERAQQ